MNECDVNHIHKLTKKWLWIAYPFINKFIGDEYVFLCIIRGRKPAVEAEEEAVLQQLEALHGALPRNLTLGNIGYSKL